MAFFLAWAVGEGIVVYRSWRVQGGPPWPGQMLLSSGVFVILGIVAEAGPGARKAALMTAWGLNVAAWLNLGWTQAGTLPARATTGWWQTVTQSKMSGNSVILFGSGGGAGCAQAPVAASPKVGTSTANVGGVPANPVLKQGAGAPGLGVVAPVVQNPQDPLNPTPPGGGLT